MEVSPHGESNKRKSERVEEELDEEEAEDDSEIKQMRKQSRSADVFAICCNREVEEPPHSWEYLLSQGPVDAKTLKSNLCLDENPNPHAHFDGEGVAEKLGLYPDWEELAAYMKQLLESEGFDLDVYKNLGCYADVKRLDKDLEVYLTKELDESMKAAMKYYKETIGEELKDGKFVKSSWMNLCETSPNFENPGYLFYMTFTAKGGSDDKERHYQAKVEYDSILQVVADVDMVRPKKEQ